MKTIYRITEKEIKLEGAVGYIAYGIAAFCVGIDIPLRAVDDIFTSREDAEELITLCNRLALSLCQLDDVIYDTLSSYR